MGALCVRGPKKRQSLTLLSKSILSHTTRLYRAPSTTTFRPILPQHHLTPQLYSPSTFHLHFPSRCDIPNFTAFRMLDIIVCMDRRQHCSQLLPSNYPKHPSMRSQTSWKIMLSVSVNAGSSSQELVIRR